MNFKELLKISAKNWYEPQQFMRSHTGRKNDDGLATFVVEELKETFDENAPVKAQLCEAARAIQTAIRDMQCVYDALCDAENALVENGEE